ncbi:hypothetical protein GpartN1_g3666.t1 [Galdieria partita]|uniref:Uncharacterized protein n=1 Tax=Galdieria partita TaxID=83374 RepID=A0A9C7UQQ9_9RHOD|nr:hypothetical protein GpartN1_g3666.t1 [Galdieria partita]
MTDPCFVSSFILCPKKKNWKKLKIATSKENHFRASNYEAKRRLLCFTCVSQSSLSDYGYFSEQENNSFQHVPSQWKEMIKGVHRCFVTACIPGKKPYTIALSDFISATATCFRNGIPLETLNSSLGSMKETYFRPLKVEEFELLRTWLILVYKTLKEVLHSTENKRGICETDDSIYDEFVKSIVTALRVGYSLEKIRLEQAVFNTKTQPRTEFESALLSQSTRIVVLTVQIANEFSSEQ